jgi:ABC-type cobalamin/Fe3+-siderophores transport system ATPase subunit
MLGKTILQLLAHQSDQHPQYLLLDEAGSALDIHRQQQMLLALKTLQHRYYWGIVLLSHDFTMGAVHADKMLMMQNQSIAHQGFVPDVLKSENLSQVFQCAFDTFTNQSGQVIYSPSQQKNHASQIHSNAMD